MARTSIGAFEALAKNATSGISRAVKSAMRSILSDDYQTNLETVKANPEKYQPIGPGVDLTNPIVLQTPGPAFDLWSMFAGSLPGKSSVPTPSKTPGPVAAEEGFMSRFWNRMTSGAEELGSPVTNTGAPIPKGRPSPGAEAQSLSKATGTGAAVRPKTFITYIFKNKAGEVVYVGRASGTGTAEAVLKQRIAKGHHILEADPTLTAHVQDVQTTKAASMGAEQSWYEFYKSRGASLLNDPNTPPLSNKPSKAAVTEGRVREYINQDVNKK